MGNHPRRSKRARYVVAPITDMHCSGIAMDRVVIRTNDLQAALEEAQHGSDAFGRGILDTVTGALDVGLGFDVPAPELEE